MQHFFDVEDHAEREAGDLSLPVTFAKETRHRISKRDLNRRKSLLPNGVPRWVRCYDNGGETNVGDEVAD